MSKASGTISQLRNGRFWARGPKIDNKRKSLGVWGTREEAQREIDSYAVAIMRKDEIVPAGVTFAKFGLQVIELRETEGVRGADAERRLFNLRVLPTELGGKPLGEIAPSDVANWTRHLATKKGKNGRIKRATIVRALTVVSSVFSEAIQRGLIPSNPCVGVEVRARADEAAKDVRTILSPEEQRALLTCEKIPEEQRLFIAFAMFTGIRPGEFAHNFLRDLHLDDASPWLFCRYGSKGQAPKGGKPRRVELLPGAIAAIERWLELRPTYMQGKKSGEVRPDPGLIFVSPRGTARASDKVMGNGKKVDGEWVDPFKAMCRLAGIQDRPGLVWYCLRHTCATSLLEGWWGPPWSLEEVKEMLGHSSVTVTEGYARATGSRLRGVVSKMPVSGYAVVTRSVDSIFQPLDIVQSRESGLNRRPALYESETATNDVGILESMGRRFSGSHNHLVETPAAKLVRLLEEGRYEEAKALAGELSRKALQ